jgi:hypothetical protein
MVRNTIRPAASYLRVLDIKVYRRLLDEADNSGQRFMLKHGMVAIQLDRTFFRIRSQVMQSFPL